MSLLMKAQVHDLQPAHEMSFFVTEQKISDAKIFLFAPGTKLNEFQIRSCKFSATRIQIRNHLYGSGSGSGTFHHQANKLRKP
jgi:hypothetical protein